MSDVSKKEMENVKGSFLSLVLQDIENQILMVMYKKFKEMDLEIGTLMFDGLIIEKNGVKDKNMDDLLLEVERTVKKETGYEVKLVEKPMEEKWNPENMDVNKAKEEMKVFVEEHNGDVIENIIDKTDDKGVIELRSKMTKAADMFEFFKKCEDGCDREHVMIKDGYYCECIKYGKQVWYQWSNGIWCQTESPEVDFIFESIEEDYKKILRHGVSEKSKSYSHLEKITKDCGDNSFRNQVMNMWMKVFKKETFEELIDSNLYLVGFNNGLYDLKEMVFRPRKKDDYISMTVGYDFKESSTCIEMK
ncbi:hypothetical protein DFJ73DRAFT_764140 [Zopfochytrium polystomum]|nr:hypothetical protein DFJ73DRAFT_764140 [Zopfochytrium polystomum]